MRRRVRVTHLIPARKNASLSIALAFIVLIAQLGAQAHAYTHQSPAGNGTHPVGCADCNAHAPLLVSLSGSPSLTLPATVCLVVFLPRVALTFRDTACAAAYRSRAPPVRI